MEISARKKDDVVIFDIEGEIRRSDVYDVTLHQLCQRSIRYWEKEHSS